MTINNLKQPHTNISTNSKSRIPNILNEHFTSVGPSLANKLPPFEKHFTEYLDKKKSPVTSFFFTPISPKEIKLEILSMPQNKSYGFYSFPVSVLKDDFQSELRSLRTLMFIGRTRWNANRCYSLRTTYLIFETFQSPFPTDSLIFTAVKLFHEMI